MNYQTLSASLLEQGVRFRKALVQLPVQARSVLIGAGLVVMVLTLLALGNIFGWWMSSVSEISATKPRISRLLGYIEAAPSITATLADIDVALSELAIEDTGDTGRGGALLQQQLRQLASEAGLTVVGSEVKEPEALDALVKLNATLELTGGPDDFDAFLERLYLAVPALFPGGMKIEAMRRINRRRNPSTLVGTEDHVMAKVDIAAFRLSEPDA
jgi:hypothetical protein